MTPLLRMTLTLLLTSSLLITNVHSHGFISDPRTRGALKVNQYAISTIDENAPIDYQSHFPSGEKDCGPGCGKKSTTKASGGVWTPYEPLDGGFRWRAGVCGDAQGGEQDHLKGGKFYGDGKVVKEYKQGEVVDFEVDVVVHHNGFFEFWICDVDMCDGGDISQDCMSKSGACEQLMRAASKCDSGKESSCGPIDKSYPGRWYMPPQATETEVIYGGKGDMLYQLPKDRKCDHCVVQFYWVSANFCNPPGFIDYFEGDDKPNFPPYPGQAGAKGGYSPVQPPCGDGKIPEEYWNCADVQVGSGGSSAGTADTETSDDAETGDDTEEAKPAAESPAEAEPAPVAAESPAEEKPAESPAEEKPVEEDTVNADAEPKNEEKPSGPTPAPEPKEPAAEPETNTSTNNKCVADEKECPINGIKDECCTKGYSCKAVSTSVGTRHFCLSADTNASDVEVKVIQG